MGLPANLAFDDIITEQWVDDVSTELAALSSRYAPLAATPRGRVASHIVIATQTGFGTGGGNIATTVTFTFDAARKVEIFASIPIAIGATAVIAKGVLACSGIGTLVSAGIPLRSDGAATYMQFRWEGNIASGSKTLTFNLSSNAGTVDHVAAAATPSIISINDVGV